MRMKTLLKIHNKDKILIIAPHPDDESIGCGGLLLKYASQCDIWVLSRGEKGCLKDDKRDIARIRTAEFKQNMRYIKPNDYKLFDLKDTMLWDYLDFLNDKNLNSYNKIFITQENDNHPDHAAAYVMVRNTLKAQNMHETELYQYEVGTPLICPNIYLEITDIIEKKKAIINKNKSQITIYDYQEQALSLNKFRGIEYSWHDSYYESYLLTEF